MVVPVTDPQNHASWASAGALNHNRHGLVGHLGHAWPTWAVVLIAFVTLAASVSVVYTVFKASEGGGVNVFSDGSGGGDSTWSWGSNSTAGDAGVTADAAGVDGAGGFGSAGAVVALILAAVVFLLGLAAVVAWTRTRMQGQQGQQEELGQQGQQGQQGELGQPKRQGGEIEIPFNWKNAKDAPDEVEEHEPTGEPRGVGKVFDEVSEMIINNGLYQTLSELHDKTRRTSGRVGHAVQSRILLYNAAVVNIFDAVSESGLVMPPRYRLYW